VKVCWQACEEACLAPQPCPAISQYGDPPGRGAARAAGAGHFRRPVQLVEHQLAAVSEIRSRSLAMGPPPHRVRVGPHYPSLPAAPGANTLAGLHRAAGAARQPPSAHGPACGYAGRGFTRPVAGPDRTSFSDGASRQRAPCRAVLDSVEGINGTGKSYLANPLLRTTATPAESCCPGHACGSRFQRGRLSCGHQDSGSAGASSDPGLPFALVPLLPVPVVAGPVLAGAGAGRMRAATSSADWRASWGSTEV